MDAVAQVSSSANAVNQILVQANAAAVKQAEKLMEYAVAMKVGLEAGKGQNIDISA